MISLTTVVYVVLYLLGAAIIFALLYYLVGVIGKEIPGEGSALFVKFARIGLLILAVLVLISVVLYFMGGVSIFVR